MTISLKGKQSLVIAAGGHGKLGTKQGDYIVAFTLPWRGIDFREISRTRASPHKRQ
ncbi:MAG TPA: hypothetical protein VHF01_11010 [Candidatus Acidoferrum sp.]|nr:hypothetical protein [Candidatus Acidoferrum sp.]